MKKTRSHKKFTSLFLISSLLIAMSIMFFSSVFAQQVEVQPVVFVNVSPNPIGSGQSALITVQMDKTSPTVLQVEGETPFIGFTVTITKPDGTTEDRGPYDSYATSGFFFVYTPNQIGTHTFVAHFPGQSVTTPPDYRGIGTTPYSPSTTYVFNSASSTPTELIVQEDPIPSYPDDVTSTDTYWERPINSENKGWWQVADNWLMEGYDYNGRRFPSHSAFAPYTAAPNSAHILWRRPLWFGGIGGGKFEDRSYFPGLSYEQPYLPLILQGRIIYTEHDPVSAGNLIGTRCLDLYNGEEIWFKEDVAINFAQVLAFDSPNEHGLIAHLWSQSGPASNTTYQIYDGMTGKHQFTITNVPRGDTVPGPKGEILNYVITGSGSNRRMIVWNSTKAILDSGSSRFPPPRAFEYYTVSQGTIVDGSFGIQLDVSIPDILGSLKYVSLEDNLVITHGIDPSTFPFTFVDTAFNAKTGALIWTKNITNVYGHYAPVRLPYSPRSIGDGVRVIYDDSMLTLRGYDLDTGNEIWVTDPVSDSGWAYFNQVLEIAYGKVYHTGYDGYVRAYNTQNGNLDWEYYLGNAGFETPYGTWPVYAGFTIADEKVFFTNDDHSPDSVLWRGGKLYSLDANSGDEVWSISGWFRMPAVADGYLTATNSLDGQIYVFGKGPSQTTVIAPLTAVTEGSKVMITGSVLDMSPGMPNTPCVSDESMSDWMEYLYMQKECPADVMGVQVKLTAVDPNGNFQDIGTATTDSAGKFGMSWTPPVQGDYQVTATFEGTESYGSSMDTTYFTVGPAPSPETPIEPEQPEPAAPLISTEIAIIAAVAVIGIVGVAAYYLFEKDNKP